MSAYWDDGSEPDIRPSGILGGLRLVLRGGLLGSLVFGGLGVLLIVRLLERPLCGLHRPVTPHITVFVCRNALRILGLRFAVLGAPMEGRGAVVANHASWLDIFALNAAQRIYFVSKSEVAGWPGIGWLARSTGTVFIERNPARAREQTAVFRARLLAGHKLLFFPEGTSTDGRRVLPFKSSLFEAFFDPALREEIAIQPVTLNYHAPRSEESRFYGWWGEMTFGGHLVRMLAAPQHGTVEVVYHDPLRVADYADRKALAAACEAAVRDGHSA